MGSTLSNILLHIITSTENREPLITSDIEERLYQYIGGTVRGEGGISSTSAALRIMST